MRVKIEIGSKNNGERTPKRARDENMNKKMYFNF
jgi:hypothetical protein